YDLNCRRIYVNPAYAHQTGIPQDRAICEKPETQWDKYLNMLNTTAIDYQNKLTDVMKSGKSDSLYVEWVRLSDGEYVAHDLNVVAEYDEYENITGALVIGHNITKRKVIEKKVEHMAHHDALTNLPNRILAKARAEQAIESAKRDNSKMALLFIDLDGFKTINDSMGHTMGDEVLKIVASRIMNEIEENDTVCRQGGDEFLIILPDINSMKKVVVFIENLLSKFEKVFYVGDHAISTSASIGIAIYPDNGDSFESLLQNADVAMYKAKENGKNTYSFYTKQMNQNNTKQFKIQNDLKKAISNNEFVVYYQPQIDLAKNHIVGVEALIRWQHPELGMIPPMSFIPIAESSGLIITIGEWVLKEACRQAAIWSKHGIILTVAVNISAVQFKRGNLEEIVKKALSYSGLDPRFLELELTESIMINDVENVLTTVKALKALGVQLSIDDFGTGYSSLAYLKRFAIDKLKIDQSFIRDILNDKEDAAIVKTIIQMAKNLNLKTIAEGVENKQVLDLVSAFGCDEVQGYHFAKPMPVTQFKKYQREFISKKLQGI
ncbi:EAL domain-containing protein, partial [bacterium]|nr:EAL domain-containing protein [bacterium]